VAACCCATPLDVGGLGVRVTLLDLLSRPREHDRIVCIDGATELRFGAFRTRTLRAAAVLRRDAARRYALCIEDPYEFSCALFAVLAAGKHPVIPANTAPGHLSELAGHYDAVLYDLTPLVPSDTPYSDDVAAVEALDRSLPLTLYTSGSAGTPKEIRKTLAQFDAELVTLDRQWGAAVAGATVIASVPHHHIYGLLFRLLWPLSDGRAFDRATCVEPTQLFARVAELGDTIVISSPSHLARWPQLAALETLLPAPRLFFSSGGPLSAEAAARYTAALGAAPIEIYGSTETGGIGWRRRGGADGRDSNAGNPGDDAWRPLPGISVDAQEDGLLKVRSPHLGHAEWHRTDDAIVLEADGRFRLEGRRDRIVKVEGKRVSMPALEARLDQHTYVAQAALVAIKGGTRERLGAAVALSAEGVQVLHRDGSAALAKILRRYLAQYVDLVVLPRRWRFVRVLPFDSRGKLPAAVVLAMFAPDPLMPDVLAELIEGDAVVYDLRISPRLSHFSGHFPGFPILPGVIQVDWAVRFAQRHFAQVRDFQSIDKLKFMLPVRPGDAMRLTLAHEPERHRVQFTYQLDGRPCASGRIGYGAGA